MRRITFLLLLVLACSVNAKQRTLDEMKQIAQDVLNGNSARAKSVGLNEIPLTCSMEGKTYAMFSAQNWGFVIVSKNDVAEPVLGYSYNSTATNKMPDALKFYLDCFDSATSKQQAAMSRGVSRQVTAVEPFVTTQWGQDSPYNLLTPEISGKHTPVGCVAMVMAQIINYT